MAETLQRIDPTPLYFKVERLGNEIWTPRDLAAYLKVSVAWVYKRSAPGWPDPIPRCPGVGRIRFNTNSKEFQHWLQRQIGMI